jgi:hypothetical protein
LIAWEPSLQEWGVLGVITMAGLLLAVLPRMLRRSRRLRRMAQRLLRDVRRDVGNGSRAGAERASRAARRILEHLRPGEAFGGLSSNELELRAQVADTVELRDALEAVARFDLQLYAPPSAAGEGQLQQSAQALITALDRLIETRRNR